MIAFKITINDSCTRLIGIDKPGNLSAHLSTSIFENQPDLCFHVGAWERQTQEHVKWADLPDIHVGDKITIEIVEADQVDMPISMKTPAQMRAEDREFLANMEEERKARFAAQGLPLPEIANPELFPKRPPRGDPDDELPPLAAPWE